MSKTIPPACPIPDTGPKYWRSLDEVSDTPAFRAWVEREFPAGASELVDPVNRRSFMKLMSASFMLVGCMDFSNSARLATSISATSVQ